MAEKKTKPGDSCLLYAFEILGDGRGAPLADGRIFGALKDDGLAWVHADRSHPDCAAWIEKTLPYLHPLTRQALLAEETRPRVEEIGDGLLINLRAANLNEGEEAHDMLSMRLWVDESRIVSLRRRRIRAVEDVKASLEAGTGPKDAGAFVAALCYRLIERTEPFVVRLDEAMDDLEERVISGADIELRRDIIEIRRQAIAFRRFMAPQREAVSRLRTIDRGWIGQSSRIVLLETYDHLLRFIEELDSIRERSQVVQDELQNALADQLNKRMYVLAIVAAIFLPLSFLTGLLGINVAGIPGAESPWAFAVVGGGLAAVVGLQAWWLHKKGWF